MPRLTDPDNPRWKRLAVWAVHCKLALLLGGIVSVLVISGSLQVFNTQVWTVFTFAQLLLLSTAVILTLLALFVAWDDYIEPHIYLRDWVLHMRGGNLSAKIPVLKGREFAELAQDLNSLGEMLESLSRDTEQQLQIHTEHMAQKTRSLGILYDIAANINASRDLDDLLTRFLHTMTDVVDASAAAVRLMTRDGKMRMVASIGLSREIIEQERLLPARECLQGEALSHAQADSADELLIGKHHHPTAPDSMQESMLIVPLKYRGHTLGVYNLYVDQELLAQREEFHDLLTSISRHLGMAIEKSRLDEEANRLAIMEERTRIANELHDSLAQTFASLRFQVRVLDETLHQDNEKLTWEELEKIENTVDEAHTELRELIAHFRAPVSKGGLIASIEQFVSRFREESDIHVFLQTDWPSQPLLPAEIELQVLRIVQEALTNARKHSEANAVRVLLRGDGQGNYRALIEDDGIGMIRARESSAPGEHLGLSIMRDRANRIHGRLKIESEPGEGVRIVLNFRYVATQPAMNDDILSK